MRKGSKMTEEAKKKISIAGKGRTHSEESKAKMRKAQHGDKNPMYGKTGEKNPNFGKPLSEERKTNISQARKGHTCNKKGKDSPFWKPDKTDEERLNDRSYIKYKEWRACIFERDKYTCQKCGQVGKKLNAHHIEDYANNKELRIQVSNGITFCKTCHKDFHHQYGSGSTAALVAEFLK